MARLYANENFPWPTVESLQQLGHDVETSLDSGLAGAAIPDDKVLDYAIQSKRALLTFNRRHFVRLHLDRNGQHAGIIVCTFDADFVALAKRIDTAIRDVGDLNSQLVRVNRPPQQK